ncbi:hypothetical protein V8E54_005410 [Elaphomyces granulatus]
MGFSARPFRLFAERRPGTLEEISAPRDDGKSAFCLKTKYGLRLRVFPDGSFRISSIRPGDDCERLREEMDEEMVNGSNSKPPRIDVGFFFEWADIYDDSFERQECHYGSRLPTFPCVDELVAWATEGVLMACWLSLQDHVYEVKYMPHGSFEYYLRKGQLEEELERFLVDMEALLQAEFPPGQGQESHSK